MHILTISVNALAGTRSTAATPASCPEIAPQPAVSCLPPTREIRIPIRRSVKQRGYSIRGPGPGDGVVDYPAGRRRRWRGWGGRFGHAEARGCRSLHLRNCGVCTTESTLPGTSINVIPRTLGILVETEPRHRYSILYCISKKNKIKIKNKNKNKPGKPGKESNQAPDKRTWSVAQKAHRLAGSFSYCNANVQHPDRLLRENLFANWDSLLIGGSLSGFLNVLGYAMLYLRLLYRGMSPWTKVNKRQFAVCWAAPPFELPQLRPQAYAMAERKLHVRAATF
jgi:hypothetical protein